MVQTDALRVTLFCIEWSCQHCWCRFGGARIRVWEINEKWNSPSSRLLV